jgi:hypothetical protein
MTESELSKHLVTALKQHCECIIFKIHGHGMQAPGWPDFFIASEEFTGWVETKGSDTEVSDLQRIVIGRLKKFNVPVYVLRFVGERYFVFEDEDKNELANYRFSTWRECAIMFLATLGTLEEKQVNDTKKEKEKTA